MRIANNTLISAPVTLDVNWESGAIYLGHIAICAVQLVFTGGTINGSFKLQASNDLGDTSAVSEANVQEEIVNWTDIAGSSVEINAAGDIMYNVEDTAFRWVRVVWTVTSGTGSLTSARFNLKGV